MEYAGFWLSVIALLVGVVAILWRVFSKPRITLELGEEEGTWGKALACKVWNLPIERRYRRWLGFRREDASDIAAVFSIREEGTDRLVACNVDPTVRLKSGVASGDTRVPSSRNYRWVSLIVWRKNKNDVVVAMAEPSEMLSPGRYTAEVGISGTEVKRIRGTFEVGKTYDELRWCGQEQVFK